MGKHFGGKPGDPQGGVLGRLKTRQIWKSYRMGMQMSYSALFCNLGLIFLKETFVDTIGTPRSALNLLK